MFIRRQISFHWFLIRAWHKVFPLFVVVRVEPQANKLPPEGRSEEGGSRPTSPILPFTPNRKKEKDKE